MSDPGVLLAGAVEPVDPRPLRRLLAEATPASKRPDVWYWLYIVVVFGGFYGYAWVRAVRGGLSLAPVAAPEGIAVAMPVTVLLAGLAAARLGIVASPLSLSAPDAAWLLPAPIERRQLLGPSLHRGLRSGALVGLGAGVAWGVVAASIVPHRWAGTMIVAVVTFTLLGLGLTAGTVLVAASDRTARAVVRLTPVVVAVAVGLVLLSRDHPRLALASGPWGWVAAPVADAAGLDVAWWPAGAAVLLVATALAVRGAHRATGAVHHEQLARQAGAATGLRASLFVGDLRTVTDVGRETADRVRGRRDVRVPAPRHPALAIPWTDVLSVARSPAKLAWAMIGAITIGAVLGVSDDAIWGPALVVALAGFATVWMSLDVARLAFRLPEVAELLPVRPSNVVLQHSFVPIVSLSLVGTLTAVGAMTIGQLAPAHVVPVIVMVAAAVPFLVLAQVAAFGTAPDDLASGIMQASTQQSEFGIFGLVWKMAPAALTTIIVVPTVLVSAVGGGLTAWQNAWLALGVSVVATPAALAIARLRLHSRLDH